MTLGILLPTRGRPGNLERFIQTVTETAHDWHLYVRIDRDDPYLPEYRSVVGNNPNITTMTHDRVGFGESLNQLVFRADYDGMDHVGMFGDDVIPETVGWDLKLVAALNGDLGVSYGDDGLRDKHAPDLPTHYVTQTEVYRRLGYLSPPGIRHLFLDNVARDIGRHLRNFVYSPVVIRHIHPWAHGEKLHDTTYAEGGRNSRIREQDRETYLRWRAESDWKRRLR